MYVKDVLYFFNKKYLNMIIDDKEFFLLNLFYEKLFILYFVYFYFMNMVWIKNIFEIFLIIIFFIFCLIYFFDLFLGEGGVFFYF